MYEPVFIEPDSDKQLVKQEVRKLQDAVTKLLEERLVVISPQDAPQCPVADVTLTSGVKSPAPYSQSFKPDIDRKWHPFSDNLDGIWIDPDNFTHTKDATPPEVIEKWKAEHASE